MKGRFNKLQALRVLAIALGVAIVGLLIAVIVLKSPPAPFVPPPSPVTVTPAPSSTNSATFSSDGSLVVSMPQESAVITAPVGIEGSALGTWFFEGTFPIEVRDSDGSVLGRGTALALGDWETTGTVPFAANIPFTKPHHATGAIVFMNDNPSGIAANAIQFSLAVRFK